MQNAALGGGVLVCRQKETAEVESSVRLRLPPPLEKEVKGGKPLSFKAPFPKELSA